MLGLNASAHEGEYYALFDIGATSIGVAISRYVKTGTEIVWYARLDYGYQGTDDYARYLKAMYATLLEAGMKLTSEGVKQIREHDRHFSAQDLEVMCMLAPPWFAGSVLSGKQGKEKPFEITHKVLNALKKEMLSSYLHSSESMSWQEVMGTPELLELYFEKIYLEGYPVREYMHRRTKEIHAEAYVTIVSEPVQKHVEEVLGRVFPNHDLYFATSTRLFANMFPLGSSLHRYRGLFVEIGGQITSVSLLKDGAIAGMVTIPLGTNHLLQTVAPKALSADEARGKLNVLFKKEKNIELESLPSELQEPLAAWSTGIHDAVRTVTNGTAPPRGVAMSVGSHWYPLYKAGLEEPWDVPGVRKSFSMEVRHINPDVEEKQAKGKYIEDNRLVTFSRVVHEYARKEKITCYTIKKSNL